MSDYKTLVCDRCGKDQKMLGDSIEWSRWRIGVQVNTANIARLYAGMPDFRWAGDLCPVCAENIDAGIRALFGQQ